MSVITIDQNEDQQISNSFVDYALAVQSNDISLNYGQNGSPAGANGILLLPFSLPYKVKFTNLSAIVSNGNIEGISDWGIFGLDGGLRANVGGQTLVSVAPRVFDLPVIDGVTVLDRGAYLFAFTSNVTDSGISVSGLSTSSTNPIAIGLFSTMSQSINGILPNSIVIKTSVVNPPSINSIVATPFFLLHS